MPRVKSVPKRRTFVGSRTYYKPKRLRPVVRGGRRYPIRYRNGPVIRRSRRINTYFLYNRLRARYGYRR